MLALTPPTIEYPADGSVHPVTRFQWHPVTVPPPRGCAQLAGKRIVVVGGEAGTARRISRALESQGARVFRFAPTQMDQEAEMVRQAAELGRLDGIVDLNIETPFSLEAASAWEGPLRQTLALLKSCYEDWAQETDAKRLFYVAVTLLGGEMGYAGESVRQPLGGIWAGLAKTLPRELPNCNIKVLDLADSDHRHLDEILLDELSSWDLFEVGYRNGRRCTLSASAEPVGSPNIDLGPEDAVLVSGGSRGIGFALAKSLAQRCGCRVVVTGRSPLPDGTEPWARMDATDFRAYRAEFLRTTTPGQTVADRRREYERLAQLREARTNLVEQQARGLRIDYAACDVTSPSQVQELIEQLGAQLSGVIHNAGVDAPVRLVRKSFESFEATVRIKLNGFFNLVHAVGDRRLKVFCSVGSLTGRWGGMVGELDYAAANDGLTRAGFWATADAGRAVRTVCWPTWDRLGMITNFDVAVQYAPALAVDEGVYHWQRELLAATPGEAVFMGPVGNARSPAYLRGFPVIPDLANINQLYSKRHYLGTLQDHRPFHSMHTRIDLRPESAPCLQDVLMHGKPVLPVSLLLEYAVAATEWVLPQGAEDLQLHEIRDVSVDFAALKLAGTASMERIAVGSRVDSGWVVEVELVEHSGGFPRRLACARLMLAKGPPPAGPPMLTLGETARGAPLRPRTIPTLTWAGFVYRPGVWWGLTDGSRVGQAIPTQPADLWATPLVPSARLPGPQLETIFQAALATEPARLVSRLSIGTVRLFGGVQSWGWQLAGAAGGTWTVAGDDGRVGLAVERLTPA
jgi:NAD(P)-dependent dehydrogenase (short-subunit alcohol dehydrogenase family)